MMFVIFRISTYDSGFNQISEGTKTFVLIKIMPCISMVIIPSYTCNSSNVYLICTIAEVTTHLISKQLEQLTK